MDNIHEKDDEEIEEDIPNAIDVKTEHLKIKINHDAAITARKRLEEKLEEKRLRDELDDYGE